MKNTISIIGIFVVLCAYGANPETRDIATSQYYVDTQLSNRQDLVPAKTGDKAVTPTGTKGTIGEREIKTNLGNESNISDIALTTVETVKTAIDNKQEKISELNSENIITYTGMETAYSDGVQVKGPGVVTSTPIYDDTVNTYANGLIRAEKLNDAVTTGVSGALTQVSAGFVINDIGNVLPTTAYLPAYIDGSSRDCYKLHTPSGNTTGNQAYCSSTLYNSLRSGDWGAVFPYETGIVYATTCGGTNSSSCGKEIHGTSVCSSVTPQVAGGSVITDASKIATLNQENETQRNGGAVTGEYCYYKLLNPSVAGAPWVYRGSWSSPTNCATKCAHECGWYVPLRPRIRRALFSAGTTE